MVKKLIKPKKTSYTSSDLALFVLRIALGWLFLYSGVTKIMDPSWNAAGFLSNAKTFSGFFTWFASTENIGWVNAINAWGQALIGLSLVTGTLVRISSVGGILLMLLYYFPGLTFPLVKNGYLVDEHIIYILVFAVFIHERAGTFWGLDALINKKVKNWLV
jgi:thiosulfate dehydrogenase [quinone] large subunit